MKKLASIALLASCMVHASVAMAATPQQLNLGILGGENAVAQIGNNQCIKTFLDKELHVDTQLRNSSDYSGVIQGLLGGKVDLVLGMSPSALASVYIRDPKAVDIVGIAVDDADKSRGYHSVVIVKADSPYQKLEDLKGKSFAVADPDSTSGFLIPNQTFQKQFGGSIDNQYNGFFSSVTFAGGHEQDVLGVLNGQFEGAVTWSSMVGDKDKGYTSGTFTKMMRAGDKDLMKKIRIIWESPLIPNVATIVSNKLDPDFKAKLVAAVKKLDTEDHSCFVQGMAGAQHIGPATFKDYENVIELKRALINSGRG